MDCTCLSFGHVRTEGTARTGKFYCNGGLPRNAVLCRLWVLYRNPEKKVWQEHELAAEAPKKCAFVFKPLFKEEKIANQYQIPAKILMGQQITCAN